MTTVHKPSLIWVLYLPNAAFNSLPSHLTKETQFFYLYVGIVSSLPRSHKKVQCSEYFLNMH